MKNEEFDKTVEKSLLKLSKSEDEREQTNIKCKKFCNWIQKMKIKLLFWRK